MSSDLIEREAAIRAVFDATGKVDIIHALRALPAAALARESKLREFAEQVSLDLCYCEAIDEGPCHPCAARTALEAATPSAGEAGGWRPIATAPKDGTRVLLFQPGWDIAVVGEWGQYPGESFSGWLLGDGVYSPGAVQETFVGWNEDIEDGAMPTHWMPLPPADTPTRKDGE